MRLSMLQRGGYSPVSALALLAVAGSLHEAFINIRLTLKKLIK